MKPRPSLQLLASVEDPFEDMRALVARLKSEPKEGRHLEWKSHPPTGPAVTSRAKYRMVKAAISFANWEGGFIVFGITPDGSWKGIEPAELRQVDPAAISELINGCLFPEIPRLNYRDFELKGRLFAILHTAPSPNAPHITTKTVHEKDPATGRLHEVLAKHAMYCRQGAKSDLATPHQHHQILARQTERLRSELLRRFREVPVPFLSLSASQPGNGAPTLTVARLTSDPKAPAIRLTRQEGAAGVFLHEELSNGLFEEINNVIDANRLLALGRNAFVLGEPIYYRVYAERQHVNSDLLQLTMLANTGLRDYYAPNLSWLLRLPTAAAAGVFVEAASDLKSPQVHGLIRLASLLGREVSDWLWQVFQSRWRTETQRPDYYYAFDEIRKKVSLDLRLLALRQSGRAMIEIPNAPPVSIESLLQSPAEANRLLSLCCVEVFSGNKQFRQSARHLDVLAYGAALEPLSAVILKDLPMQERKGAL